MVCQEFCLSKNMSFSELNNLDSKNESIVKCSCDSYVRFSDAHLR